MEKIGNLLAPLGFNLCKFDEGPVVVSPNGRWLLLGDVEEQSMLYDIATMQPCDQAFVGDDLSVTAEDLDELWQTKTSVVADRIRTRTNAEFRIRIEDDFDSCVGKYSIVQFTLSELIVMSVERHSNKNMGIPNEREYTLAYGQLELPELWAKSKVACFFESGEKWVAIIVLTYFAAVNETETARFVGFDGQQVRNVQLPGTVSKCTNSMYSGLDDNHFCFWTPDKGGAYMVMKINFDGEISIIPVASFATPQPQAPLATAGFSIYYRGEDERLWKTTVIIADCPFCRSAQRNPNQTANNPADCTTNR